MSTSELSWAFALKGISPLAKLVAIALGDAYHQPGDQDDDRSSRYPIERLAEFCSADREDIEAAIEELWGAARLKCHIDQNGLISSIFPVEASRSRIDRQELSPDRSLCYVYVIAAQSRTKIGISRNVTVRIENLQAWAPEKLRVVWTGKGPRNIILEIERAAHAELASVRIAGEWFEVSPERAIEVVQSIMKARGLNP